MIAVDAVFLIHSSESLSSDFRIFRASIFPESSNIVAIDSVATLLVNSSLLSLRRGSNIARALVFLDPRNIFTIATEIVRFIHSSGFLRKGCNSLNVFMFPEPRNVLSIAFDATSLTKSLGSLKRGSKTFKASMLL